jgi:hypothetical protein
VNNPFVPVADALNTRSVRYLLIGVYGANLYAPGGQAIFMTDDADLLLPLDADNLVRAWDACESCDLKLWLGSEPLEGPRDRWLAERVIERRALTRATGTNDLQIDLALSMTGFDFDTVWNERRLFIVEGVELAVARLGHIIASKHATGRDKDRLFLATHRDALEQLLKRSPD